MCQYQRGAAAGFDYFCHGEGFTGTGNTEQDLVLLGHIDVVMAPVDGVYTMSQPDMAAVLEQIHPRLVLPMHYFMRDVVERFVGLVRDRYAVRFSDSPTLMVSRATLPARPTIVVLPGVF